MSICGPKDARIRFSRSWTLLNFFVSSLQILGCAVLFYHHSYHHCIMHHCVTEEHTEVIKFIFTEIDWLHPNFKHVSYKYIVSIIFILHATVAVLTTLFIFWDWLMCCCCSCWLGAGEWRVHDPDNPEANLVWRDGRVVNLDREQSRKALY